MAIDDILSSGQMCQNARPGLIREDLWWEGEAELMQIQQHSKEKTF